MNDARQSHTLILLFLKKGQNRIISTRSKIIALDTTMHRCASYNVCLPILWRYVLFVQLYVQHMKSDDKQKRLSEEKQYANIDEEVVNKRKTPNR